MTTLYLDYDQQRWSVGGYDPDDEWSRDSHEGTYTVTGVSLTPGMRDAYETDEDIQVGDEVFVLYAEYTTGDTFGSDGGYGQILAVTKVEHLARRAEGWAKGVESYTKPYSKTTWPSELGKEPYPYWVGYFEHLDKLVLDKFVVQQ